MAFAGTLHGASFSAANTSKAANFTVHNFAGGLTAVPSGSLTSGRTGLQAGLTRIQRCSLSVSKSRSNLTVYAIKNGETLDRPLRVAVVGGGPGGASTADTLASSGIETYLFERKLDNCKVGLLALDWDLLERLRLHKSVLALWQIVTHKAAV